MRFFKQVFEKYPDQESYFVDIEEHLEMHQERFIGIMKPLEKRPERLIGQNALFFAQKTITRSHSLLESIVKCINHNQELGTLILIRAHYETTGCIVMLYNRLNSFYQEDIEEGELDSILRRMNMGSTMKIENADVPKPVNAMTYIDEVDKYFKRNPESRHLNGLYREGYDQLSEYCHPNFSGLVLKTHVNKVGVVRFGVPSFKWLSEGLPLLSISITLFVIVYDKVIELLMKHEELPILFCRIDQRP